ncbi:MAG: long-chain fatty acid--CoA ligase [Planctomycetales bacterium]|nr:long-chain fatty acid--CoA ligase [Planctomycetales bacterium]
MRLYESLLKAASEEPDRHALELGGQPISFAEFADAAQRVTVGLKQSGIQPGDSVAVMLPNLPQFAACEYGVFMAGAIFVPVNVMLTPAELEYVVRDSNVRALVVFEMWTEQVRAGIAKIESPPQVFVVGECPDDFRPFAELVASSEGFDPTPRDTGEAIMTLYTSGTTGSPKGALITHANVIANINMVSHIFPTEPSDRTLCVLPLFHCFALNSVLNMAVHKRTCVVLHPRFEVESCFKALAGEGITSMAGVPTMYFYLLKHPDLGREKFTRLRYCISGGAAMPVEVLNEWESRTGVPIYEGFGMTETTVSVSVNRPDRRKVGSIGLPFDGVEMAIVDEADNRLPDGEVGELIIRAPNVMKGYLNKPIETAEVLRDGWFHTGDLARRDEDGFFYIVDRKKDMIIKGGFNIYPREIEEVIYQRPEIAEAAVIGVHDDAKGEQILALVTVKHGAQLSENDLRGYLEQHLARYKLPQMYEFRDELPKGPTGKILKRELRQQYTQWNRDRVSNGQ